MAGARPDVKRSRHPFENLPSTDLRPRGKTVRMRP
jgi:hypothetical protein